MGLSTSHGCWPCEGYSGGYGHFHDFRTNLARVAGYGIKVDRGIDCPDIDYESFELKNCMGIWDKDPDDILIVLLIHSDCEGFIYKEHVERLSSSSQWGNK